MAKRLCTIRNRYFDCVCISLGNDSEIRHYGNSRDITVLAESQPRFRLLSEAPGSYPHKAEYQKDEGIYECLPPILTVENHLPIPICLIDYSTLVYLKPHQAATARDFRLVQKDSFYLTYTLGDNIDSAEDAPAIGIYAVLVQAGATHAVITQPQCCDTTFYENVVEPLSEE